MIEDESVVSDEDIEEELGYISPLDSVDPYLAFKRSLSSEYSIPSHTTLLTYPSARSVFQMKNPSGYQVSTTALSPDQQMLLAEVMRLAEVKEAEVPAQM